MTWATLSLHTLLCLSVVMLVIGLRRDFARLRNLGPGGQNEDLDLWRRLTAGLRWKIPTVMALLVCAVVLGLFWAEAWRQLPVGQIILTALLALAGINAVIAFAKAGYQEWSPRGSMAGVLKASLWGAVSLGLLGLTVAWRFGV
jgi:hypothetical protein